MDLFWLRTAGVTPELERMAAAYERRYGHPPSTRTRWLMDQQAAAMTRRPKSAARKIHGNGDDAGDAERLAAWEAQTAAKEMTALSQVHKDVAAFGLRPVAVIDDAMKAMAGRAAGGGGPRRPAGGARSARRWGAGPAPPPGGPPRPTPPAGRPAVGPRAAAA